MYFVAALIPMLVGFIYYNPRVLGNAWMRSNNFVPEYLEQGNMAVIFGLSYLFSLFLAFMMPSIVIHQGGLYSLMAPEAFESGSAMQQEFNSLMERFGDRSRTFGHGAFHSAFAAILFALPLIAINALFERRGWRYIWIHVGYWLICITLIGGLLCATLDWAPLS